MEKFWGAVLDIGGGQRVGLDIHTSTQLGEYGPLGDRRTRDEHSKSIVTRAKADRISTVFLVWNRDVFKWPEMTEMRNSLEQELDQTKLVVRYGSPQEVVKKILTTIQQEGRFGQPTSSIRPAQ
jgi:hypothetical protein